MTFWINISENLSLFINAAKQLIIMRPACCCELDKTCISGESDPPFVLLLSGVWTWRIKIKIMSCRLPPPHHCAATASEAVSSLHFPAVSRPAAAPPCAGTPHSLSRPRPANVTTNTFKFMLRQIRSPVHNKARVQPCSSIACFHDVENSSFNNSSGSTQRHTDCHSTVNRNPDEWIL